MLSVRDLHLSYGNVRAVRGIDFTVEAGEIVTLIGANGAGKSSTLRAISSLHPVTGTITLNGERIDNLPAHAVVAKGIAHCPEGRRIFYDLSVRDNLAMGGYLLDKSILGDRMAWVIERFPRLGERLDQSGGTLSGGEQQMLAIGRALMAKPALLMLDEPSLGLSPLMTEKIFEVVVDLNKDGLTVLLVEQNARFALEISHRAYVLETGKVTLHGESRRLANDPKVVSAYLGG